MISFVTLWIHSVLLNYCFLLKEEETLYVSLFEGEKKVSLMFRDGNKANNSKSGKDSVLCRIRMIRIKQLNALLKQPLNYSQEFCLYKLLSNIVNRCWFSNYVMLISIIT